MIPLADLIAAEEDFLSRANLARQWAEKKKLPAALRHRHHATADMAEDAAKRVREIRRSRCCGW